MDSLGNEIIEGADLEWIDLTYKVPLGSGGVLSCFKPTNYKVVLQPFSAVVKAKTLIAVMGSSGAGKTTFLNTLSYQCEGGIREGTVLLNGRNLSKNYFRKMCGYVRQSDVLIPTLTVYETLEFYANIILTTLSRDEKQNRIYSTARKLGLMHCLESPIGDDFKKGISGGEKRRVSIAIELLKNPTVLFLDEPTSGLDSKTALSLINTLSELAHVYNHTIMCTIHQPRSQIFNQFDQLLLLAKGTPVYMGPTSGAVEYFASKGFDCPHFENPADFFIDVLTIDSDTQQTFEESSQRIEKLISESTLVTEKKKSKSRLTLSNLSSLSLKRSQSNASNISNASSVDDPEPPNFIKHHFIEPIFVIYYLFMRSILSTSRNQRYLFGRITQSIVISTVSALLWWQMDTDQSAIQDRVAFIFLTIMGNAYPEGMVAVLVFPTERLIYLREKKSGMYSVFCYYVAKQLSEIIFEILVPTYFIIVTYMCVGLQYNAVHFGNFYLLVMLMVFSANSVGLLCGAFFPAQVAAVTYPVSLLCAMMFAGFYVNTVNIPTWIRWAKYISPFFYAMSGALIDEFTGRTFYCKSGQYFTSNVTATCSNGEEISIVSSDCQYTRGKQIIDEYGTQNLQLYQYQLVVLLFILICRFLLYFALHRPPNRF